jgi:hypothetical protein
MLKINNLMTIFRGVRSAESTFYGAGSGGKGRRNSGEFRYGVIETPVEFNAREIK